MIETESDNPINDAKGASKKRFNPLCIFLGIVVLLAAAIIISKFP
jgi:hypothetical protein